MPMIITLFFLFTLLSLSTSFEYVCKTKSWSRQPRIHLNDRQVLTRTAHNFSMIVDGIDQVVSKSILDTGSWETSLLTLIAAFVSPKQKVMNIGSQTGMEAVLMGRLVGDEGKLTVFQPFSASYKILVKNLHLNGLGKISKAYKLGAGDKEDTLGLWIDETNTGGTTFIREEGSRDKQDVPVRRLDDVMGQEILDFVLMDTEKSEVTVLEGMRNILERSTSVVILLEWEYMENTQRDEEKTKILLEWLMNSGFKWYRYTHNADPCKIGTISQLIQDDLLKIVREDILLVANRADISKLI